VAVVNPSVIIAPGDGMRSSSKLLQYIWDEHKFYINKQLNFVDVRDVARAIVKIYQESVWGERYILNKDSIMYQSLFDKLAKKLAKKPPNKKIPIKYLKLGILFSKIWSFISNRPQLIGSELIKTMKESFTYSSKKIHNELQFEFNDSDNTFDWVCEEFSKMKSEK
jgi:nucleoside-diphosphate-sugar epimerase